MATYREIYGRRVEVLSADPSNLKAGQIWYNSASGIVKGYVLAPATIETGGNPGGNGGKTQLGGCGTVTAGLIFGGEPTTTATEEYDGTSWTNVNAAPTGGTDVGSAGTQTAALWVGGTGTTDKSFEYDGTNWTNGGALITARQGLGGSPGGPGTKAGALAISGYDGSAGVASTEGYDGTAWSTRPSLATGRYDIRGAGGPTAALAIGGEAPGAPTIKSLTEEWTGETTALNVKTLTTS